MNLKEQSYLRISRINQSNFFTKEVSEPKILEIVKSVKVWSPPGQLTGRQNGEQLISENLWIKN